MHCFIVKNWCCQVASISGGSVARHHLWRISAMVLSRLSLGKPQTWSVKLWICNQNNTFSFLIGQPLRKFDILKLSFSTRWMWCKLRVYRRRFLILFFKIIYHIFFLPNWHIEVTIIRMKPIKKPSTMKYCYTPGIY